MMKVTFSAYFLIIQALFFGGTEVFAVRQNHALIQVHDSQIHSIFFHAAGLPLTYPVYELNSPGTLQLRFDDLSEDFRDFAYTIELCNRDWTASDLDPFEYIDGYLENTIDDYQFSSGTYVNYAHFQLDLPNDDLKFTKSGNYRLLIFEDGERDSVLLSLPFSVVEQLVSIEAEAKKSKIVRDTETHHAINMTINYAGLPVRDAFSELEVTVVQNSRNDLANRNIKPHFVNNEQLMFNSPGQISFPAGREFRYIDLRTFIFKTDRMKELKTDFFKNVVTVAEDEIRSYKEYFYLKDLNGRKIIELKDSDEPNLEADYATTHFNLPVSSPFSNGEIYIFGGLTNWNISENSKMVFNEQSRKYETSLLLKQGYYDYEYIYVDNSRADFWDHGLIEGNFFDTENDYQVFLYYRPLGERYDRLVGHKVFNSLIK